MKQVATKSADLKSQTLEELIDLAKRLKEVGTISRGRQPGFLIVADSELDRIRACRAIQAAVRGAFLDVNAEPTGKSLPMMAAKAYGFGYQDQKNYDFGSRVDQNLCRSSRDGDKLIFVIENFQDLSLRPLKETKVSLAYLRSLGREPLDKAVIAFGSTDSLEVIKLDPQLVQAWQVYELAAGSGET